MFALFLLTIYQLKSSVTNPDFPDVFTVALESKTKWRSFTYTDWWRVKEVTIARGKNKTISFWQQLVMTHLGSFIFSPLYKLPQLPYFLYRLRLLPADGVRWCLWPLVYWLSLLGTGLYQTPKLHTTIQHNSLNTNIRWKQDWVHNQCLYFSCPYMYSRILIFT